MAPRSWAWGRERTAPPRTGAIYVFYLSPPASPGMNATGIETYSKIGDSDGNFDLVFEADNDWFGSSITAIGDLDDDGQIDLAVGARKRGPSSPDGSVIVLFMDPACSDPLPATPPIPYTACGVRGPGTWVEIAEGQNGFTGENAGDSDELGSALAWLEDASGLAPNRLIIGEHLGDSSASNRGQLWSVTLDSAGQVTSEKLIAHGDGFTPTGVNELFAGGAGFSLASIGDVNDDGIMDLVGGTPLRDWNGQTDIGTAWVLALNPCTTVIGAPIVYHSRDDDGLRVCPTPELQLPSDTMHLYLDAGPDVTLNPADVCVDDMGEGDEVCALDIRVVLEGGYTIDSSRQRASRRRRWAWPPSRERPPTIRRREARSCGSSGSLREPARSVRSSSGT